MPRGGKRDGAGRPTGKTDTPESDRRDYTINLRLSNRWHQWLKDHPGRAARLVEEALEKTYPPSP